MIARSWEGITPEERAEEYADHARRTGVTDLAAIQGNRGVYLLRRREPDGVRFRVLSLWDSMDGIRRFAGRDAERDRYYPENAPFLLEPEPRVEHFEVVATERGASGEVAAIAGDLRVLARGDAWHGPSLEEMLREVSPEAASARAVPAAHTIWELVLHLTAWADVYRRRLEGRVVEAPELGDFPPVAVATAAAWAEAKACLFAAHERLVARVERMSSADLDARVPGKGYSARFLLRGAIRHTVYHSGQIGLLRKMAVAS